MLAVHDSLSSNSPLATRLSSLGYSGEHFDAKAQQQYLRARFYDPANGRFNRLDPFAGNMQDPQSLHKYTYVHGDPIHGIDPSGLMMGIAGTLVAVSIGTIAFGVAAGLFYQTSIDNDYGNAAVDHLISKREGLRSVVYLDIVRITNPSGNPLPDRHRFTATTSINNIKMRIGQVQRFYAELGIDLRVNSFSEVADATNFVMDMDLQGGGDIQSAVMTYGGGENAPLKVLYFGGFNGVGESGLASRDRHGVAISSEADERVLAHELGHVFGLRHALSHDTAKGREWLQHLLNGQWNAAEYATNRRMMIPSAEDLPNLSNAIFSTAEIGKMSQTIRGMTDTRREYYNMKTGSAPSDNWSGF